MINKSFLSEFITPITDRTAEDINELRFLLDKGYKFLSIEEKELWKTDHKGALNASDLNRISNNSYVLGKCLGITVPVQNFQPAEFLRTTDFFILAENLENVINETKKYTNYEIPTIPDFPFNDYIKINSIENIQYIIYNIIKEL